MVVQLFILTPGRPKGHRSAVPAGVACILFGSTARGQAKQASDLDLLVVATTQGTAEQAAARIRQGVALTFPLDLAIASLGAKELRRQRNAPWLRNALKEGETLSKTSVAAFA